MNPSPAILQLVQTADTKYADPHELVYQLRRAGQTDTAFALQRVLVERERRLERETRRTP